jgi:hypothetical protein
MRAGEVPSARASKLYGAELELPRFGGRRRAFAQVISAARFAPAGRSSTDGLSETPAFPVRRAAGCRAQRGSSDFDAEDLAGVGDHEVTDPRRQAGPAPRGGMLRLQRVLKRPPLYALWHRGLLGRPTSESGRLRQGDGGQGRGDRHRMSFMLLNAWNRRRSRQAAGAAPGIQELGAKLVPNVGGPSGIIPRCRHAEASPVRSVGFS